MGRKRLLILAFGYLALIICALATMLSACMLSGRPLLEWPTLGVMIMFASYLPSVLTRILRLVRLSNVGALNDAHATVILRRSKIEWICGLMIGAGIFVMGALPILGYASGNLPIALYYFIAAMGCYIFVGGLVYGRPQLMLSQRGFTWSQVNPSFVPWSDIAGANARQWMFVNSAVMIEFREAGKYKPKGGRKHINRTFGLFNWQYGVPADALANGMELRRKLNASQSSAETKETR